MQMIRIAIFSLAVILVSCKQQVRSQESDANATPEPVASLEQLNDNIYTSRQTAITRAVEEASPAVVSISVTEVRRYRDPFANDPWMEFFFGSRRSRIYEQQVSSVGSGFVISPDGYIVTNEHVAHNPAKINVAFIDGSTLEATLIGSDEVTDLALLKVNPSEALPHLEFSHTDHPIPGEWAIALGNPFGLFQAAEPTVTVGVVSGVGRDFQPQENRIYRDMIQTDAAINQGNSGGPLINAQGKVIGVNTFIYTAGGGGGSIGLGFAVPANKAQSIIQEIRENGQVDRSYYIGMYGVDLNERYARALGLQDARGFIVQDVEVDSPADQAGFKPYDVIRSFEGETITGQMDFAVRLYDYRPGDVVRVGVLRDGREMELTLELGSNEQRGG